MSLYFWFTELRAIRTMILKETPAEC